ncbi:hypothetical protein GF318_01845 [Candidatus Micrarchaeota archaeon]|nr:hypothetical protein [Candidatus Micrarchaeota archaeon]
MKINYFLLFFLFSGLVFAQAGSSGTEGGNITDLDAEGEENSTWHGVAGQTLPSAFVPPVTVNATPNAVTILTVNTGISSCDDGEYTILNLLFSNSSTAITSLVRGDLPTLDSFIAVDAQDGTDTFILSQTFETAGYGTINGVPATYTNAPSPTTFPLGYLQDQDGNLVFITPVVEDQAGFNGTSFDFQLMLPTNNGTPVMYYLTVDLECEEEEEEEEEEEKPPQGGGGTGEPYYNETRPPPEEIPPEVGPPAEEPCDIILYCGEWGPCIDGYRKQRCWDVNNCSDIEVFRMERCIPGELPPEEEVEEEEIPLFVVTPELPCLPLLLLVLLIIIVFYIYWRRKGKRGEPS